MIHLSRRPQRTRGPVITAFKNQHIDSSVRATVLSMNSQSDALVRTISALSWAQWPQYRRYALPCGGSSRSWFCLKRHFYILLESSPSRTIRN